ncbi:MAG TPA: uridine diphosphate-N-acetylglucosamine-binding protein YvcK [Anaerolineaceae bacterium]|nr:uridine diphosphate-N-acetylglucosamine-binding protein YvcK [Anaerolineaceae bacterium]
MGKVSGDLQQKFHITLRKILRWLKPGINVKRWLLLMLVGLFCLVSFLTLQINIRNEQSVTSLPFAFSNTPLLRVVLIVVGLLLTSYGFYRFYRSLMRPFIKPGTTLLDTLSSYQKKEKGPRIVTVGGGNGLATLLRGLKQHSHNLTAVVTVADDGGSSGQLRQSLGILPPGDIRNCLTALSSDEELLTQVFQYRFGEKAGVNGHSLGNLLISALTDITGSFEEAVAESGRVLAIKGRVLPSTLHDVNLVAEVESREKQEIINVAGESQIPQTGGKIRRLWIEPSNPLPYPPAVQAILAANLIIIGPGSLYTSILPNLLVPGVVEAINSSKALKFFICNVANEHGETDGYRCIDHIRVIEEHLSDIHFDVIICNNNFEPRLPRGVEWVLPDAQLEEQYSIYYASLVDKEFPWRHDYQKLAEVVVDLLEERTGPLNKS